jgi:hypothetical protein
LQLCEREAQCFFLSCSFKQKFLVTILEMLGQLLDDLGFARRRKLQGRDSVSNLLLPLGHD